MRVLITGGAGFIGSNLASHHLKKGDEVIVIDNLSRKGTVHNKKWLESLNGDLIFHKIDIRQKENLEEVIKDIDLCYHCAAQVAVTTSVIDPYEDFQINLLGTVNLLEALRKNSPQSIIFFTSTNKVYGKLANLKVVEKEKRYIFKDLSEGVGEDTNLDFYSPYGCSKGGADQYMIDYSRIYNLKTVVFRMSCIYGVRQLGNEDQGWVAHFLIQAFKKGKVTIFGDGKQVRDILYIDDLIRAFEMARENIEVTKGKAYNIGGGPENTISLLELIELIESKFKIRLKYSFSDWRPGDQKVYISSIKRALNDFKWKPLVGVEEGIERLFNWIEANSELFV